MPHTADAPQPQRPAPLGVLFDMLKPDLTRTPFTHAELMLALTRSKQETALYFGGLAPEIFFKHVGSEWSAAENLDHLNKTVSLLVRAFRVPRVVARIAFGAAKAQSRRYDNIVEAYSSFTSA